MTDLYETKQIPMYLTQEYLETCRKERKPEEWKTKMKKAASQTCNYTTHVLFHMLPVLYVIRNYKIKACLINDIVGGLTVTFMQIPQGMGYAIVSDLPVEVGLFMGFFPVICYFLLGSSKHLSFGPVIVISMMLGNLMEDHFPSEKFPELTNQSAAFGDKLSQNKTTFLSGDISSREKIQFAAAITIISGLTQIVMGLFRLGFLIKFLSDAIISAFSAGVGFTVGISQLKNILGVSISRNSGFLNLPKTLYAICLQLPNCHYPELLLSLVTIIILYTIKTQINERFKHRLRIPVPIDFIVVVLTTVISYAMQLEENYNFKIVGHVPQGLPTPFVPDISDAKDYISDGISIGIIAFVYSISVALFVSRKEGYDIDANQELFAYGISNFVASFFGCFTSAGAVSRTSVQLGCGAKSQVCSLINAVCMLIVISVAGSLFKTLPICVLSCIIIVSLRSMVKEVLTFPKLWRICKYDGVIWLVTFVALILSSVGTGLLIGAILGICSVIMRTLWVEAKSLGVMVNTDVLLDKDKYEGVTLPEGITVVSFASPLYFANVDIFRNEIDRKTEKLKKMNGDTKHSNAQVVSTDHPTILNPKFIIECSGIAFIDGMGAASLHQLYVDYKEEGNFCYFSGINDGVISVLKASGFFNTLRRVMHPTIHDAMLATNFEENDMSTKF